MQSFRTRYCTPACTQFSKLTRKLAKLARAQLYRPHSLLAYAQDDLSDCARTPFTSTLPRILICKACTPRLHTRVHTIHKLERTLAIPCPGQSPTRRFRKWRLSARTNSLGLPEPLANVDKYRDDLITNRIVRGLLVRTRRRRPNPSFTCSAAPPRTPGCHWPPTRARAR